MTALVVAGLAVLVLASLVDGSSGSCDGCMKKEECYPLGAIYHNNKTCVNLKCQEGLNVWKKPVKLFKVIDYGCHHKNECIANKAVIKEGCNKYKCVVKKSGMKIFYSLKLVDLECKDSNGECIPHKTVFTKGCTDYRCVVKKYGRRKSFAIKPIKTRCKSFDGKCINPGSSQIFPAVIGKKLFSKCTCKRTGKRGVQYVCGGKSEWI